MTRGSPGRQLLLRGCIMMMMMGNRMHAICFRPQTRVASVSRFSGQGITHEEQRLLHESWWPVDYGNVSLGSREDTNEGKLMPQQHKRQERHLPDDSKVLLPDEHSSRSSDTSFIHSSYDVQFHEEGEEQVHAVHRDQEESVIPEGAKAGAHENRDRDCECSHHDH